ncbi:MAG: glycine cleavage system protein GcvH [Rhodothermales bacterium]
MDFPSELRYTKEHEWIRLDGDIATIGITAFAQKELGDIVFVEIEDEGSELDADDVFGTVEAVKTVSELYMPISGTIAEINEELDGAPELVNEDPYGQGWMVKIKVDDPDDVAELLSAEDYGAMVG